MKFRIRHIRWTAAFVFLASGIIPVMAQSGVPEQPVWLNLAQTQAGDGLTSLAAFSRDDEFFLTGYSTNTFGVSGFFGNNQGLSSLSPGLGLTYRDAQLFHPNFSGATYYSGGALNGSLGEGSQWSAGVAQVNALGLADRLSWFGGLAVDAAQIQLFRVDLTGQAVAHAISLGLRLPVGHIGARYLKGNDNTYSTGFEWQMGLQGGRRVAVSFNNGLSERFRDGAFQRWLVSYSGSFGRSRTLWATEGGSSGLGVVSTAALAAAAVAIAVVATSGSDKADSQLRFATQNAAAQDVLNKINPKSVQQNVEYGGWVYRNSDASFSATEPKKGTVDSVAIGSPESVPNGRATASYHTHGAFDPRYDSENFSTVDIAMNNNWRTDGYLATPAGYFKYHNYLTGIVTTLGRVAN